MELNNDFRVGVDRATAWKALTDLERVAPLLPGAQLQEVEGDEYRGIVKVKVGLIEAQYKGTATLIETDEVAGRIVLEATGRDTRGQGDASVTVTVTVAEEGAATLVTATTDLTVSGKVAQFGHGVLSEVSATLVGQFAANLERDLTAASGADRAETNGAIAAPVSPDAEPTVAPEGPRRIASPEPEPVDLFEAAGTPLAKRLAPVAGAAAVVLAVVVLRRRRRASRAQRALRVIAARTPDPGELVDAGRRASRRAARHATQAGAHAAEVAAGAGRNVAGDLSRKAARRAAKHARKAAETAATQGQKAARQASAKAAKKAKRTAAKAAATAAARAARH